MYRRIFYLFPNKTETQKAVNELLDAKLSIHQMHVLSRPDIDLEGLPASAPNQQRDTHTKIENSLWNLNLVIFFVALFVLVISFISVSYWWASAALSVMIATYWAGYYYLTKPTIHLAGFHAAFEHSEILLMVDVPKHKVAEIEQLLSKKNPSALEEGISWTPSDLSMNV
jgi:hypothetical protein